jgi:hypothetical protein
MYHILLHADEVNFFRGKIVILKGQKEALLYADKKLSLKVMQRKPSLCLVGKM